MQIKKPFLLLSIFGLSLFLSGCLKDKDYKFSTEILGVSDLSHEEATITVDFDSENDIQSYQGGILWSKNADFSDPVEEAFDYNVQTEVLSFKMSELSGSTTYYVRSYFHTDGEENEFIVFSDVFSFTTIQTPSAPCVTMVGEMQMGFSSSTWIMDPIITTPNVGYYTLESQFDLGRIEFRFSEIPASGIYSTNSSWTSLDEFEVTAVAYIQESWTCVYETAAANAVHVQNDGSGGIQISFCDLALGTTGGCSSSHVFTGAIGTP